jgi:hypothetical protein
MRAACCIKARIPSYFDLLEDAVSLFWWRVEAL